MKHDTPKGGYEVNPIYQQGSGSATGTTPPSYDTPRTNAAPPVWDGFPSTVSRDFARQLERELVEKEQELTHVKQGYYLDKLEDKLSMLLSERDQLKREHDAWKAVAQVRENEIHCLIDERDQLKQRVEELEKR